MKKKRPAPKRRRRISHAWIEDELYPHFRAMSGPWKFTDADELRGWRPTAPGDLPGNPRDLTHILIQLEPSMSPLTAILGGRR